MRLSATPQARLELAMALTGTYSVNSGAFYQLNY